MLARPWAMVFALALSLPLHAEPPAAGQRARQAGTPVVVDVRSDVGNELRLTQAVLLLDGEKVAQRKPRDDDGELERTFRLWSRGSAAATGATRSDEAGLTTGEYAMTVELVFEGRPVGFITYTAAYKHRVSTSFVFNIDPATRPVAIRVIANQRANVDISAKDKIVLSVEAAPGSGAVPALDPRGARPRR
jgi:hypothetical protein